MTRYIGYMDFDILKKVTEVIENDTLVLHHYGESLLDTRLEEKIKFIKKAKPNIKLVLNTNGSLLNPLRVRTLLKAGLNKIIFICSWFE
jgi:MoaA/NifB/PqqE/SkfB family radical SAM enzyme